VVELPPREDRLRGGIQKIGGAAVACGSGTQFTFVAVTVSGVEEIGSIRKKRRPLVTAVLIA
jgi:hypothetical protein